MIIKIHKAQAGKIVALCDEEIIGRDIEEGNIHLDLKSDFYKGKRENEEYIRSHLENAKIINAVGKKSVGLCVKLGKVFENNIIYVKNIPHVQVLSV